MSEPVVDRDAPSEVLRASHVLAITIEHVRLGDWRPEEDGPLKQRLVELRLRLDDALRGRTDQLCGESVALCVRQRGSGTLRVSDDYGVWSRVELAAGKRLVAFCHGSSLDLTELLQPPACELLIGPEVLPDVRTSLDIEVREWSPAMLLARVAPLLAWSGGVLARYVWARIRAAAMTDPTVFDSLAQTIEAPATSADARDTLLTAAHEELTMREVPPRPQLLRLARAMLALLAIPQAVALHANLAQVYLPNLIGLSRGAVEVTADDAFAGVPDAQARIVVAQTALAARPDLDPNGQVQRWLQGHLQPAMRD